MDPAGVWNKRELFLQWLPDYKQTLLYLGCTELLAQPNPVSFSSWSSGITQSLLVPLNFHISILWQLQLQEQDLKKASISNQFLHATPRRKQKANEHLNSLFQPKDSTNASGN